MIVDRYFIASKRGLLPAGGTVLLRFYAELNDHLRPRLRGQPFRQPLPGRASVKDVIQSLGVPHTEVELILINGASATFDTLLNDGDRVSVYPTFKTLDISPLLRIRPQPLHAARFLLDVHLGRLGRYLRMLGFDTHYENDSSDAELALRSRGCRRILLTRDRDLLKRNAVTHGTYIYASDPLQQLFEVVERFHLQRSLRPFRRCMVCNGLLVRASKRSLIGILDAKLLDRHTNFRRCRNCGRVYWPGTHHARLLRLVNAVREQSAFGSTRPASQQD